MAEVYWTIGAQDDLAEVVAWFSRSSPVYASSIGERILARIDLLEDQPRMGRVVPEYEDDSIRELIVANFRVVYLYDQVTASYGSPL